MPLTSRNKKTRTTAAGKDVAPIPPPTPEEVPEYLARFGFAALSASEWESAPPQMSLSVEGHEEVGGHTYYYVQCQLVQVPLHQEPVKWRALARLSHLRSKLHDLVKKHLGDQYKTLFQRVPFAHRGGPKGTTSRLDTWCRHLAKSINERSVPPIVAAVTLSLMRAPGPGALSDDAVVNSEKGTAGRTSATAWAPGLADGNIPGNGSDFDDCSRDVPEVVSESDFPTPFKKTGRAAASANTSGAAHSGDVSDADEVVVVPEEAPMGCSRSDTIFFQMAGDSSDEDEFGAALGAGTLEAEPLDEAVHDR
eukprot:TRINITY_DN6745_c0_g1_i1.p1 TRINITY_DN6745_c0_g1~~TRINITY_DN6745_c0_g1_i1.p1  ORF type:complete len:308 (+),score=55.87 TRINITY_DN6745_c0_g1_i1:100-1023(+)